MKSPTFPVIRKLLTKRPTITFEDVVGEGVSTSAARSALYYMAYKSHEIEIVQKTMSKTGRPTNVYALKGAEPSTKRKRAKHTATQVAEQSASEALEEKFRDLVAYQERCDAALESITTYVAAEQAQMERVLETAWQKQEELARFVQYVEKRRAELAELQTFLARETA